MELLVGISHYTNTSIGELLGMPPSAIMDLADIVHEIYRRTPIR